ncbi:hypothetical protein EWB00_003991 [Schistosoma japonicum]|uniref:Tetraspanin n=2 Tax=Schistosoma japonicum TaxID=6182 RepID=A0A4Z2D6V4_SCHJA|nr:hypothetical protein KSF78_0004818 [Schistosoma japonicum]KAH8875972.1 hypothetical protein KSF78_0004818 [Schistosoma japonicum]KAH8875973.1 hypothetical protein KSF78_0004818 [Schistosoma japonicum]KAH8875974.1 hypothetical protein KSF78_0004818 [Schistosoma japonicum]TNN12214.1 hypothetical protein EWB00_003991 [Schistosoma japonicum]
MGFKTYRTIQTSLSVYLKNTLVAHQILYLLLMAILVGLACWLLIWTVQFNEFETIMKTYYFSSGKLILLLSSIVGAGVAVFGYCIFNVSSPILLLTHIICNFILISAFLSVSVCGFLLLLQLDFDFANKFTLAITKYYGINLSLRRNVGLTTAVDEIQSKFECCGTFGEKSSNYSWFLYKGSSTWFYVTQKLDSKSVVQYVPDSCCVLKDRNLRFNNFLELQMKNDVFLDRETCIGYKSLATRDDTAPRIDNPAYITRSNTYLYEKGCVSVVKQEYQKYALMLAASGTTALVLSIVGFIISSVLLFHIEYQQFIRLSTEWSASVSTANIQSSVQDNINIIPKHLTEDEILAKA